MFKLLIVKKDGSAQWSGHTYTREELADETASAVLKYGRLVDRIYLCRMVGVTNEPAVVKQYG